MLAPGNDQDVGLLRVPGQTSRAHQVARQAWKRGQTQPGVQFGVRPHSPIVVGPPLAEDGNPDGGLRRNPAACRDRQSFQRPDIGVQRLAQRHQGGNAHAHRHRKERHPIPASMVGFKIACHVLQAPPGAVRIS